MSATDYNAITLTVTANRTSQTTASDLSSHLSASTGNFETHHVQFVGSVQMICLDKYQTRSTHRFRLAWFSKYVNSTSAEWSMYCSLTILPETGCTSNLHIKSSRWKWTWTHLQNGGDVFFGVVLSRVLNNLPCPKREPSMQNKWDHCTTTRCLLRAAMGEIVF